MAQSVVPALDSAIPSGSWSLYYHSLAETKWSLATFQKVATMATWRDFWAVVEELSPASLADGMFFLMRDPIPPLWENAQNIYGGSYSMRIPKDSAGEAFVAYAIAAMIGEATTDAANGINGLSISPKRGFCIIKVWNKDCTRFKDPAELRLQWPTLHSADILYTPFVEKNM